MTLNRALPIVSDYCPAAGSCSVVKKLSPAWSRLLVDLTMAVPASMLLVPVTKWLPVRLQWPWPVPYAW
jgi:hypothetical protein